MPFLLFMAAMAAPITSVPSETLCISRAMATSQLYELGERFYWGDSAIVATMVSSIADRCAEQWKWSAEERKWHIQETAAQSAMSRSYMLLPKGVDLDQDRLRLLFNQLNKADQTALTTEGSGRLGTAGYRKSLRRIVELLSKYKLDDRQLEVTIPWFVAYARAIEAKDRLNSIAINKSARP